MRIPSSPAPARWRGRRQHWTGRGHPAEVVEKVLSFGDKFGAYQRQLFLLDGVGMPEKAVHEQIELLGAEVLPVLRHESDLRRRAPAKNAPLADVSPRDPRHT